MDFKLQVTHYFKNLQNQICTALEQADGLGKFKEDVWERPEGGGGRSRVMELGNVIEKGGVNFSAVEGFLPPVIAKALGLEVAHFFATGVSIVMHPNNPNVPIIHMNVRYFETKRDINDTEIVAAWFGGGIDLTPHYIDKSQAAWFHQQLQTVCNDFNANYYPEFKQWADDYFFIKHRNETRGVGGIFFDRLQQTEDVSLQNRFEFVQAVGNAFAPIYTNLIALNKDKTYRSEQKQWQNIRRGRYVEFNLVYDKGTKFGLDTNGRIESILMSLPHNASWPYNFIPQAQSKEEETLQLLKKGVDWVNY